MKLVVNTIFIASSLIAIMTAVEFLLPGVDTIWFNEISSKALLIVIALVCAVIAIIFYLIRRILNAR